MVGFNGQNMTRQEKYYNKVIKAQKIRRLKRQNSERRRVYRMSTEMVLIFK